MSWLSLFTSAGRAAAKESAVAAKAMSRSAAEMAQEATRVVTTDAAKAEKIVQMSSKLSQTAKEAGTVVKKSSQEKLASVKLWAISGLGAYALGNKVINGKGLASSATELVLDDRKEGEGLGQSVWRQLVGDKASDKPLMGAGVDTVFGDGTYDGSVALLKNGGAAVGNTFSGISDSLQGFLHQAGGPGMPYPTNQYYDPSYYNIVANPQNYAGLSGDRAFMQQAALMPGGFDGVFRRLNAMTGKDNINGFNLAEMALSAFLTFGPFGKLSKLAGMLLGVNSYKSMSKNNGINVSQSAVRMQQQQMDTMRGVAPQSQMPIEEEPETVIHRSRSI